MRRNKSNELLLITTMTSILQTSNKREREGGRGGEGKEIKAKIDGITV